MARAREGAMCALRDVQHPRSSVMALAERSVEIAQAMVPLAGALARPQGG